MLTPKTRLNSEAELQAACVNWFRATYPTRIIFSIPTEAAIKQWAKFSKTGALAGVADTCVLLENGQTLWVEFKKNTPTAVLRGSQLLFQKQATKLGHRYVVVRTLEAFQGLFK